MNLTQLRIRLNILLLSTVLLMCIAGVAVAQDASTGTVTSDDVNEVARELWCPLCSGVRLDACELKACDQMKDVIAIKLAEGEDTDTIKAYFVDQYGPQVLGEPPREGFNWLAWILPVVALVFGGVFLWRQMGRMMRRPAQQDVAQDSTQPSAFQTADTVVGKDDASPAPGPKGEYERKLEEELTRYD